MGADEVRQDTGEGGRICKWPPTPGIVYRDVFGMWGTLLEIPARPCRHEGMKGGTLS